MKDKRFLILFLFLLAIPLAWAALDWEIPNNKMIFGDGAATIDKVFEANVGDGASNPKLTINNTTKDFTFSTKLSVKGDMVIGTGAAADQKMVFDIGGSNPFLKWDNTLGAIVFSNDGTIAKKIGAGIGGAGGQNFFIDNPDAESSTNNWTNIGGGTFSTFSTSPINGTNSFRWDASAQNDILRTDQIAIPEKFKNKSCQIEFTFTGGTSDLIKPQVVDSSNVKLKGAIFRNQIDNSDFLQAQINIVTRSIYFICPTSGTIAFEFNQTAVGDPAQMDFDDVYIGELKGLIDTVLPDTFSAKIQNNGSASITSQRGASFISANRTSIGKVTLSLTSGVFTISPSAVGQYFSATGVTGELSIVSTSTSQILVETFDSGGSFKDLNFDIKIEKQGSDAKQSVQVFTSIPKVSETINEFSVKVENTGGTPSTISENISGWVASYTDNGIGLIVLNFKAATFTFAPACTCTVADNQGSCKIDTSSTIASVSTRAIDTSLVDSDFQVLCQKQEADFKTATVQPVIVGQVTNSFADGGHNVRVESCTINNNGTATIDTASTLCEGWVDSVTRVLSGKVETDITGIGFGAEPNCTCSARAFSVFCMIEAISQTLVTTRTQNDAGTTLDQNFTLSCQGVR